MALHMLMQAVALLLLLLLHAEGAQQHRRCDVRLQHDDQDCESCMPGQWHRPLENIEMAVPGLKPNIAPFSARNCTHLLAACRTDGTGSQLQAKLSAYAFAQLMGLTYVHVPISQLDHFLPEQQKQITSDIERFFNLGQGEVSIQEAVEQGITPCSVLACFNWFDHEDGGGAACWDHVKFQLLQKYRSTPKPPTYFLYDQEKLEAPRRRTLTVAMHIRRGDVNLHKATDGDRFNDNDYYVDILLRIQQSLPPTLRSKLLLDIVVLSEGQPQDFESIVKAFPSTRLYLSTDLLHSLHTLISADIMVMARSSLSYVAGTYNDGVVIYTPYWHKKQTTWFANEQGNATALISALSQPHVHNLLINRIKSRKARRAVALPLS